MTTKIFHNPKCSKSRATLALLEESGADHEVVRYLETPPDESELREILSLLQLSPRQLMRTGESIYKELNLDNPALDDDALLAAMLANPILIERPIVVSNGAARIGRPPESVLDILDT